LDEAKKLEELSAKGITPETKSSLEREIDMLNVKIDSFAVLSDEIAALLKR
jgi:hypothetical protein